jgi:AcrR family transcriptional regulator
MESQQKILDSAIEVLNEDFSATIDVIADKAGLTRRTLHRHFKDRAALIAACHLDMMQTWETAVIQAINNTADPLKQLEAMLYAGIDCGVKYAFLQKLDRQSTSTNTTYTTARDQWFQLVPQLQQQKLISDKVDAAWIRLLFVQMIHTTIAAYRSGDIAPNEIKRMAWYSFRRSIGMK